MPKMIKNNIKQRQICLVFLALTPVNKVLLLPGILANTANNLLYIPLLINILFDTLVLFLLLKINDMYPDCTFEKILQSKFSNGICQVVFFLYGLFFAFKSLIPILEQKYFIDNTLYEVFPNIFSFFPLFFMSAYACVKGLKVLGRTADIAIWMTLVSFGLIYYFSATSADMSNILPIKAPNFATIKTAFDSVIWFSESLYMLIFMGHFSIEKSKNKKILLSFVGAGALVLVATLIFYGVFGPIAKTQAFAISDMTIYTTKIINIGRFDYLAIIFMLISKVFAICLPVYMSTKCFRVCFNTKKSVYMAIIVNLVLFTTVFILSEKLFLLLSFFKKTFNFFFVFMAYVLPIIMFFALLTKRRKNAETV